jgi:hypothetical protein
MTGERTTDASREPKKAPASRDPRIPKPPSAEDIWQISRDQELLTDEWTGDGPGPSTPGEGPPNDATGGARKP